MDNSLRFREGQWVLFLLREDYSGDHLRDLLAQGVATGRNGKLLGIYQHYQTTPEVLLNGERQGPSELPERLRLVDRERGQALDIVMEYGIVVKDAWIYREDAVELEPVLDRADIPAGRYVAPGHVFRP
jgi:hypothetical protein